MSIDARFGTLAHEAQDLIVLSVDLFAKAGLAWESKDYAVVAQLIREAAIHHRRIAELYETIAGDCERATGPS